MRSFSYLSTQNRGGVPRVQNGNMEQKQAYTFHKDERLCSKKLIDTLFGGGKKSLSAYPLRLVYTTVEERTQAPAAVMMSVSKRHFKHAVDRNRAKRQLREAYRRNKHILYRLPQLSDPRSTKGVLMAFLWLSSEPVPSALIDSKMRNLLHRLVDALEMPQKS